MNKFKEINDTLGHQTGDVVLQRTAERLRSIVRGPDLVCRLGGDEFAVVTAGDDDAHVLAVAERISFECSRLYEIDGLALAAPMSIGIASSGDGVNPTAVLRHADLAMYESKERAVPHVKYSSDIDHYSVDALNLKASLSEAVSRGEFALFFQPKVDLASGKVVGMEGLARWSHTELGWLPPSRFLGLMMLSNDFSNFTLQMLREGIAFARGSLATGNPVPIAINISLRSLREPDFAERLGEMLATADVPANLIILEMTEADVQRNIEEVAPVVEALRASGVSFAIDDFGTGYSSMERLRTFSVDELKLDRTFVEMLETNRRDQVIVESIVSLAEGLGYGIVAEGVENAGQVAQLLEMGLCCWPGVPFLRGAAGKPGA